MARRFARVATAVALAAAALAAVALAAAALAAAALAAAVLEAEVLGAAILMAAALVAAVLEEVVAVKGASCGMDPHAACSGNPAHMPHIPRAGRPVRLHFQVRGTLHAQTPGDQR